MKEKNQDNYFFYLFPLILGLYYLFSGLINLFIGTIEFNDIQIFTIFFLFIVAYGIYLDIIYSAISLVAFILNNLIFQYLESGFNFFLFLTIFIQLPPLFYGIERQFLNLKNNNFLWFRKTEDKLFFGLSFLYILFLIFNLFMYLKHSNTYILSKEDFQKEDYIFINNLSAFDKNEKTQFLFYFDSFNKQNEFFLISNQSIMIKNRTNNIEKIPFKNIREIKREIITNDISRIEILLNTGESLNLSLPRMKNRDEEVYFHIKNAID